MTFRVTLCSVPWLLALAGPALAQTPVLPPPASRAAPAPAARPLARAQAAASALPLFEAAYREVALAQSALVASDWAEARGHVEALNGWLARATAAPNASPVWRIGAARIAPLVARLRDAVTHRDRPRAAEAAFALASTFASALDAVALLGGGGGGGAGASTMGLGPLSAWQQFTSAYAAAVSVQAESFLNDGPAVAATAGVVRMHLDAAARAMPDRGLAGAIAAVRAPLALVEAPGGDPGARRRAARALLTAFATSTQALAANGGGGGGGGAAGDVPAAPIAPEVFPAERPATPAEPKADSRLADPGERSGNGGDFHPGQRGRM